MKKHILLFFCLLFGLAFIFLNDMAGRWLDQIFHGDEILFSRASVLFQEGKLDQYESALKDMVLARKNSMRLRALAFYNLGDFSLEKALKGDPAATKDALFYFREALRNDPLMFPAKHNLELLMKMERQKEKEEEESARQARTGEKKVDSSQKGRVTRPPVLGSNP